MMTWTAEEYGRERSLDKDVFIPWTKVVCSERMLRRSLFRDLIVLRWG